MCDRRIVSFVVPGPPQGKGRAKVTTKGKFARAYTPEQTATYENFVKLCYLDGHQQSDAMDPLYLCVTATYPIPKNTSKKKRLAMLAGEIRPVVKPDWDNIGKIVSDALNKLAWHDDSCVVEGRVTRYYGETPEVRVYFDNFSWRDVPFGE